MNNKNLLLNTLIGTTLFYTTIYAQAEVMEPLFVTTATKTEKNIDGISASVEVLTQEDIEKIGGESLKDIVNKIPGIVMQHSGGASSSGQAKSAISIRGINAKGTLILIDGRRVAKEFKKAYELNRIPASMIERIEVIKGPMSTLYGSDALGGVVNIITKKPKKGETTIDSGIRYGQNSDGDAQNLNLNLNLKSNISDIRYSLYTNYTTTEPYTQNERSSIYINANPKSKRKKPSQNSKTKNKVEDFYDNEISYKDESDVLTYGGRAEYDIGSNTIGAEFNILDEERFGTYIAAFSKSKYKNDNNKPIILTNIPIDSKEENKRVDVGLDFISYINDDLTLTLKGYKSKYEKLSTSTSALWEDLGYKYKSESYAKKMEVETDLTMLEGFINYALNDSHFLTLGFDTRSEEWDSTVFDGIKKVRYNSAYLQDEWELEETLNIILGARYEGISTAENKATFKIGVVKNFSDLLNLKANFAQGYRAPDVKEQFVDRTTTKGEQKGASIVGYNLKPEFTNTYEIALRGNNNKFSYSVALFLNQIDNQIASVKRNTYSTYENISEAETKGIESSLKYNFSNSLSSQLSWLELDTEDKKTHKDLEFQPKRLVSLNLDYSPIKDLYLSTTAKYTGKQYFTDILNIGEPNERKKENSIINSYTSVDIALNYTVNKNFNIYGGIDNIFKDDVDDIIGSSVGIYSYLGMKYKF